MRARRRDAALRRHDGDAASADVALMRNAPKTRLRGYAIGARVVAAATWVGLAVAAARENSGSPKLRATSRCAGNEQLRSALQVPPISRGFTCQACLVWVQRRCHEHPEVCARVGASVERGGGGAWVKRYRTNEHDTAAVVERSRRPKTSPPAISLDLEDIERGPEGARASRPDQAAGTAITGRRVDRGHGTVQCP
jgi:hypothetical protein